MIGIIDYGAGNLKSISTALVFLGFKVRIISRCEDWFEAERIVIPGVGSFESAIVEMKKRGLFQKLSNWIKTGKPLLGICLGLQILCRASEEAPGQEGLALFSGQCQKLPSLKVPHIGWNQARIIQRDPIFDGLPEKTYFYFVHSFARCETDSSTLAITDYGTVFSSVVKTGRVYACQFHPEKSGQAGLTFLKNWVEKC